MRADVDGTGEGGRDEFGSRRGGEETRVATLRRFALNGRRGVLANISNTKKHPGRGPEILHREQPWKGPGNL